MPPTRVLILGHSVIRRVHNFLRRNFNTHIAKTWHYDRHNVFYVTAWYSHDNSPGQAVPGTANLANEVMGRCQGLVSILRYLPSNSSFALSSSTRSDLEQNRSSQVRTSFEYILLMPPIFVLILGHSFIRRVHDFLRRNFNTHIAKKIKLRWRSSHKMAWDWR